MTRPEYHRRLMLMATCRLVDLLILTGAARDWIAMRLVHPVHLTGLPALAVGQATTMWFYMSRAPT